MKKWVNPAIEVVEVEFADIVSSSLNNATPSIASDDADVDTQTGGAFSRQPF